MKTPHAYQDAGTLHILTRQFSYLMWSVGLGKTCSAIMALEELKLSGELDGALIVSNKLPTEHTWVNELSTWGSTMSKTIVAGNPLQRSRNAMKTSEVHLVSRDNVPWLVDNFQNQWKWETLVLDESQSFKTPSSKRFKALRKVRSKFKKVILLSATPASESLEGLWSQFFIGDGGERLGKSFTAFRQKFFECDYMGWNWKLKPGAEKEIYERIADVVHVLKAEDYLELPERVDVKVDVHLSASEMKKYKELEKDYILQLNGDNVTAANAAVLFSKLSQMSSGEIYSEQGLMRLHDRKIEALQELIEQANGENVLVFYSFKHEVERILGIGGEMLDVKKWNEGKQKIAVAHAKSAGAGLNLQSGGSVMCWYSLPPSMDDYTQACGRLHRQGQTKTVVIHHLVAKDTIDEHILNLLTEKSFNQERLLDALKVNWYG